MSISSLEKISKDFLINGGNDGSIKVWKIPDLSFIKMQKNHSGKVSSILRINSTVFITGSYDKTILFWNSSQLLPYEKINLQEQIVNLKLLKNKTTVVILVKNSSNVHSILFMDINLKKITNKIFDFVSINEIDVDQEKNFLAYGTKECIKIYDAIENLEINSIKIQNVSDMKFIKNDLMIFGILNGSLILWNLTSNESIDVKRHGGQVKKIALFKNSLISANYRIKFWNLNLNTLNSIQTIAVLDSAIQQLIYFTGLIF